MATAYTSPSRQRTQYSDEQFHHRDNSDGSVRERVQRDSPVIAELRTNVIVGARAGARDVVN